MSTEIETCFWYGVQCTFVGRSVFNHPVEHGEHGTAYSIDDDLTIFIPDDKAHEFGAYRVQYDELQMDKDK